MNTASITPTKPAATTTPILGIGYGPANLALSIHLEAIGLLDHVRFIDTNPRFGWQRDQLLPGADIQNHPLRDLGVTIEEGHVSFLQYLHAQGRLLEHLHRNRTFPSRGEYADYLGWAAAQVPAAVDYSTRVQHVQITCAESGVARFTVTGLCGRVYHTQQLVIGTGRSPRIPAVFADATRGRVAHASRYTSTFDGTNLTGKTVAIVGSSQSAIEIALDLLHRRGARAVHLIHRGIGFRLKDTSPYSRRVFLPEFVDYFHGLSREQRQRLRAELRSVNYGTCDADVIDALSEVEYQDAIVGRSSIVRYPFSTVTSCVETDSTVTLDVADKYTGRSATVTVDHTVLATGYRDFGGRDDDEPVHPLLDEVIDEFCTHPDGVPIVNRDYSLQPRPGGVADIHELKVYLNGLCEESHGMGDAGALAMVAHRARDIGVSINRVVQAGRREHALVV